MSSSPRPELIDRITEAVLARGGKREGAEIRFPCVEPGRHANGDAHPSARWNPEKGVWRCDACSLGGGALDLARRLGLEPAATARSARVQPPDLDAFARARALPSEVLARFKVISTTHAGRPALRYPTAVGTDRVKYTDGMRPKYRWASSGGGHAHWYGLGAACALLQREIGALYLVNGEPSVWACVARDVPAVCVCGEGVTLTEGRLRELRAALAQTGLPALPLRIVYDTDTAGQRGARAALAALQAAGWDDMAALDLSTLLSDLPGGDVDDLQRRVHERLGTALAGLPILTPTTSSDRGAEATPPMPTPIPLDAAVAPPAFPVDALPEPLADMVQDVSRVTRVPADLPALVGLGVIAAATARRAVVAIGNTHVEPLNLYVAAVAESGERKGPMLRAMLGPLYEAQREQQQAAAPEVATAAEHRRIAEKRLERLRADAARADDPQTAAKLAAEAEALARELPPVPVLPKLTVSDRTVEKLEQDIAEQGGALLLASEEAGTLFAIAAGRYARDGGAQLDTFLKAYDGGEIDTDRIGRGPVTCDAPALSILTTPQPYLLYQLRERPDFHHRGLLPRFAFAVPASWVGTRQHDRTAAAHQATRQAYRDMILRLLGLPKAAAAAELPHLRIDGDALDLWAGYHDRLEAELRDGGRLHAIREWGSKQPARVARVAGGMHLVRTVGRGRPWNDRIEAATVAAACRIGEYLEAHALAAYDVMHADARLEGAQRVLAWIQRTGRATFSGRDAFSALDRHRFPTMSDLNPCLALLIEYGHLHEQEIEMPAGQPGRRPSPVYHVHPESLRNAPQYTQNPSPEPPNGDSADIAEDNAALERWAEL